VDHDPAAPPLSAGRRFGSRSRRGVDQSKGAAEERALCTRHLDANAFAGYEYGVSTESEQTAGESEDILRRRIVELEAALTSTTTRLSSAESQLAATTETLSKTTVELATVTGERNKLRRAYEQLKAQLELLRRRIFLAKAERIDPRQLELEFAETQAKLVKLATELGDPNASSLPLAISPSDAERPARAKPKGRRKLADLDIPEERVEIDDPSLEGIAERIGFEESYHAGYRRGGPIRIVKARVVYKKPSPKEGAAPEMVTAPNPKELYERGLLAPGLIAHILTKKFRWGMPFHRLALELESEGLDLDDSTMGRYAERVARRDRRGVREGSEGDGVLSVDRCDRRRDSARADRRWQTAGV
jgi:transposase